MTFWQENYTFIKDVYDMRHTKMAEWMENVEKVSFLFKHTQFTLIDTFFFPFFENSSSTKTNYISLIFKNIFYVQNQLSPCP